MKKKLCFLLVLLLLIIPIKAHAGDVKSTSIVGNSTVEAGDEITLTYYINFDGVEKNNSDTDGVYMVVFEATYDSSYLELKKISASGFETIISKEDGTTYITSILSDNVSSSDKCIDGELFCSSYAAKFTYKAISNEATSTNVGMGEIVIGFSTLEGEISSVVAASQSSKTIKITKTNTTSNKSNTNKEAIPTSKSSNNYLKSLEIEECKIDFHKDILEYEIDIPDDVNTLKIAATTEDSKATYKTTGADDLNKYNNKVFVTVMAENGENRTYIIRKKEDVQEEKEVLITTEDNSSTKDSPKVNFAITKKHLQITGIVIIIIICLIIIINLIKHFCDRKIDKALDDL